MKRQNTHLKHKQRFWIDIFQKKKNIQIANKHMKRCSTSLAIRETQTKTIVRHNFTPTIMAMIKKTDSKWRYGEIKTLIHCWWECRITQSLWETAWQFLKQQQQHKKQGASLVAQWLRICLPMQGTRVRALAWGDPTCRGATRSLSHNCWACASGACAPQQERPR